MTEDVVLKVKDLTKIFGKQHKKALEMLNQGKSKGEILEQTGSTVGVNKASFDVVKGEIFVIMGLSGSGKSTLIRMLNRLIEPTSGEIHIDNENLIGMDKAKLLEVRRKKMSMVFQKFALFPHRTVLENTEYGLEIQGVDKSTREQKAMSSLSLVGLKGYEHQYPSQLSGGMQQRVGLARALANDPDILLMDEAFSALDPLIRKEMQDELLSLQTSMNKTIIFITHDLDEALRIGDRIALMKDGQIVQIGTPEEILMNPANRYVEKFVEDVDLSKVLTAEHVMMSPETVQIDKGPRVALQLMKDKNISSIFVVDKKSSLLGLVTADDAVDAIESKKTLEEVIIKEIPTVLKETMLTDVFTIISGTSYPVAVTDENHKTKGVLVKGAVLGGLAGNDEHINIS
ncbi:glycine betaine/L-proline ABC transporter ATP-binding protein [Bacillus carboniphilus]|uniref:Quaternary amine transport ATP-binding protein n=1 Tax=Bacillus carboniphilus TaxID=86663 RepID=A0ABY9JRP8_9BACI|nr:glycine betaine/L-proline ABC transporter ATP-binding protein [Bacillus carboniphilus]WLR42070.1 glycine betaine/L-proline ABC transporter ATP-binding protein [Bacillus carboniphilus]